MSLKTASGLTSRVSEVTENVASRVRTKGREASDRIEDLTNGVADKLEATASYIEDHSPEKVGSHIREFVSGRQTRILLAAAGIGFFAGFAIRQLMHSCAAGARQ